ncbi:hypothetical protein PO124_31165 [Bacillus licheniformis]|nr:hypothetical protein [Bacillus licheniformis]
MTRIRFIRNPCSFPPNRIDHGRFTYAGRTYELPINESRSKPPARISLR